MTPQYLLKHFEPTRPAGPGYWMTDAIGTKPNHPQRRSITIAYNPSSRTFTVRYWCRTRAGQESSVRLLNWAMRRRHELSLASLGAGSLAACTALSIAGVTDDDLIPF